MTKFLSRKLDTFALAALLVGANYGLGFILGTGENALTQDAAGSLYAVSTGLGLLILAGLAKFHWTEVDPIWTLLGNRYGGQLKLLIGLMSWMWMVGVVAAQILGGAFILKLLGTPLPLAMVGMTVIFTMIALFPVEQVGKLFKAVLVLNSLVLVYALGKLHGLPNYLHAPWDFIHTLDRVPLPQQTGIVLTTLLLIPMGMQFQLFIVQTKTPQSAYRGCILGGIILLFLAFVPSEVVIAAKNAGILPPDIFGKETIPYIMSWIGGGLHQPIGIALILSLLISALGSGSGLLRAMNRTLFDLDVLSHSPGLNVLLAILNALLALGIAFIGGSIIELMVSFYGLYVSAVWIPFLAYLLDKKRVYSFSSTSVQLSLILGGLAAITVLITTFIFPNLALGGSQQLSILVIGIGFSGVGLFSNQAIEKYYLTKVEKILS